VLHKRIRLLADNCEHRFVEGDRKFDRICELLHTNTAAIEELTEQVRPIVSVHRDVQGVANLGVKVQKLGLWLAKWPLIGGGLYILYNALVKLIDQL